MGPYELLQHVVEILDGLGIRYLVTGSIAAMAYGEPRLTNDIDIVALIERGHIEGILAAFPPDQYYLSEDAFRDALTHHSQFNIIHPASGLKVDLIIPKGTAFDRSRFGRGRRIKASEDFAAVFTAPEDVIIMKMYYFKEGGSEKHLAISRVS